MSKHIPPFFETLGQSDWPEPEELPPGLPPVQAFDPACLPDSLKPWVLDVTMRKGCPIEFVAVSAMVCAGAMVGRNLGVRSTRKDDWTEFPNTWGALVGEPSSMKSPASRAILESVTALENDARAKCVPLMEKYIRDFARYEVRLKVAKDHGKALEKAALKNGDKAEDWNLPEEPKKPPEPRLVTNDATVEKLVEIVAENPRGILLDADELVRWISSFDKTGRQGDRAFFLQAYSGHTPNTTDRIGRGSIHAPPVALSVLGGIQPGPLRYLLDGAVTGNDNDGFLPRFGMLVWPDTPSGEYRMTDEMPNVEAKAQFEKTLQRLHHINADKNGSTSLGESDSESRSRFLRFSEEAAELFRQRREDIINSLRADGPGGTYEAHIIKLWGKTVPALALITTLCDDENPSEIPLSALEKAVKWAEFLKSHARRLYAREVSPETEAIRILGGKILEGHLSSDFTTREVYRNGWKNLGDRDDAFAALDGLAELGWVRLVENQPGPGRPSQHWEINPLVFANTTQQDGTQPTPRTAPALRTPLKNAAPNPETSAHEYPGQTNGAAAPTYIVGENEEELPDCTKKEKMLKVLLSQAGRLISNEEEE